MKKISVKWQFGNGTKTNIKREKNLFKWGKNRTKNKTTGVEEKSIEAIITEMKKITTRTTLKYAKVKKANH